MPNTDRLETYKETNRKFIEGTPVEERLWGIEPEELLPALPVELLRVLPESYLEDLPSDVREKIKKRLGR